MIVVRAPPKNSDLFMQNFTTLQALFESSIPMVDLENGVTCSK